MRTNAFLHIPLRASTGFDGGFEALEAIGESLDSP